MKIPETLATMIARAAVSEPYRQIDYLTTRELERWLGQRGLTIGWEAIHHLWATGFLHPVAVLEPAIATAQQPDDRFAVIDLGYPIPTYVDLGINLSDDAPFKLDGSIERSLADDLLWHPLQPWLFHHLSTFLGASFGLGLVLADPEQVANSIRANIESSRQMLRQFTSGSHYSEFLRVLAVLVSAEPLVHLDVNSTFTFAAHHGETAEGYFEWIDGTADGQIAHSAGISIESLVGWHGRIARDARSADPLECWRILVRHASRYKRKQLKGTALRAHDLYDHAEVLRRHLETFHGCKLPEEDVVGSFPDPQKWKRRRYGVPRTSDFNRQTFRRITRDFGVDPQARVILFLEGDTEIGFVERIAEHLHVDLAGAGVEILSLEGVGGLDSNRSRELLQLFQRNEVFVCAAVDEDGGGNHIRCMAAYKRDQLVLPDSTVWKPDFEQANFTMVELASAATKRARDDGIDLTLSNDDITREMGDGKYAAAKAIERLWSRGKYYKGKGKEWGYVLADWAGEYDCPNGVTSIDGLRPIEHLVLLLRHGQSSNYHATFDN